MHWHSCRALPFSPKGPCCPLACGSLLVDTTDALPKWSALFCSESHLCKKQDLVKTILRDATKDISSNNTGLSFCFLTKAHVACMIWFKWKNWSCHGRRLKLIHMSSAFYSHLSVAGCWSVLSTVATPAAFRAVTALYLCSVSHIYGTLDSF